MARREYPGVYPYPIAGGRTLNRTCLKDAVALGKIPSNPCDHVAHLPERHVERDWLRRHEIPLYLARRLLCRVSPPWRSC